MGIVYDLPRIGTEATGWKQKGPTCWYYSAKMILKFHRQYDKGNSDLEHIYEQWKQLHELRKVLSGIADKSVRDDPAQLKVIIESKRDAIDAYLNGTGGSNLAAAGFNNELRDLNKPQATTRLKRLQDLLERADLIMGDFTNRIEALSSFVSNAGFSVWDKDDALSSPGRLEEVLRISGPLYTSGALSVILTNPARVQSRQGRVGTGDKKGTGDRVAAVYDLRADSAHAVVVIGVNGESLYYKDPNSSHGVLVIPFATFAQNASDSLLYLDCQEGKDSEYRCLHNRTCEIELSHPALAAIA
jgi:hypothetical protein